MQRLSLLLIVLVAVSCEPPARTVPIREAAAAPETHVHDASTRADSAPLDTTPPQATPTIHDACDAFARIFAASAAANRISAAEVGAPKDTAMTFDEMPSAPVEPACRVTWEDSGTKGGPLGDVFARAAAGGWTERDHLLSADGPDGSVLAFSRGDVACLVRGSWDGGDDSDSTYVPTPGFVFSADCFRNRPDKY